MISMGDEEQRKILTRFFKCAPGEYGEGDEFLGIRVPQTRAIVKEAKGQISHAEIEKLLHSRWHEVRLCGFLLLAAEMKSLLPKRGIDNDINATERKKIAELYLANANFANNWDLVDLSAPHILGPYLRFSGEEPATPLLHLAESPNLWEQRISIVTTLHMIQNGEYNTSVILCDKLLDHPHDLIHKAIGWMLREIGKRHKETLLSFLEANYRKMPRTSLRYAIERFEETERLYWLRREI